MQAHRTKNRKLIRRLFMIVILTGLIMPLGADAVQGIVPCGRNFQDPTTALDETQPCNLCHLVLGIKRIIDYGFNLLVFTALVAIVGAAIMYIVSTGNEEMMGRAKNYIKQILTGVIIVLGAWLLINYTMVLMGGVDSNGDGVPDFGLSATGWNDFDCVVP